MRIIVTLLLVYSCSSSVVRAEDWPGWRGPRGDGTSTETGLPLHWSKTENVRWKTPIPGRGHSSPVVHGDLIFVTSCAEETKDRVLLCLDRRDGSVRWRKTVLTAPLEQKHNDNSYASSTPVTDGRRVWVTFLDFPRIVVVCYDVTGGEIWRASPGEFHSRHGFCSSPVLYKDTVIINGDQDARAFIVALARVTGKERWRADRPNRTRSYCTPLIVEAAGKPQMVLTGSKCVASYDPDTGKELWLIDGPTEQFVGSMVWNEGLFFLTAGFPEMHIMAIRPDGHGNVTGTHIAWRDRKGAGYVPSPVAAGHWFFLVNDNGVASCLDAKTGQRAWLERLGKHHYGSPVSAEGRLYFTDDDGTTFVLKASDRFEVLAKNSLGEPCNASPAVAHGDLFIRTRGTLWCIGGPVRAAAK